MDKTVEDFGKKQHNHKPQTDKVTIEDDRVYLL